MQPESEAAASLSQLEELGGAALRALSGDPHLQWSAQTLFRDTAHIPLSAVHQQDVPPTQVDQRALIDGVALRLLHSDATLHEASQPQEEVARLVFEMLEQFRVESLCPAQWPGVQRNLIERFEHWRQAFEDSGLVETDLGLLLFTIAVSAWSRIGAHPIPDEVTDVMEATRANIMPVLGGAFHGLRQCRHDQAQFIAHALTICHWVAAAVDDAQKASPAAASKRRSGFALRLMFQQPPSPAWPAPEGGTSRSWQASGQRYRVFTRAYDREVLAQELVRAAQLTQLRSELDDDLAKSGLNLTRLVRDLRFLLARPQEDDWRFAQDSGQIDGARLARLVANPLEQSIFRDPRIHPVADCAVTILLDCSGSMKAHARLTSMLVDWLCRGLDMAGITNEVLGFSTSAWHGGRAIRDWQRQGTPPFPGRLNEQLHMVFKPHDMPWRKARDGIAALRRPDLFREGLDGEALLWAAERIRQLEVRRRIVLVVSDGCPMDSATHQANDPRYLDQHLKQVVLGLQRQNEVHVCALGVGLDLGWFYRHRLAIDTSHPLNDALLHAVVSLLAQASRK